MPKIKNSGLRFLLVGVFNTGLDFAILNVLVIIGLNDIASNLIATTCAMITSFILNKNFTFESKSNNYWREILLFFVFTAFGLWILQSIVIYLLALVMPKSLPSFIAINLKKILATIVSLTWNYFTYKRFVFKK